MPEDIGRQAARLLFEEVSRGGAVDSAHQVPFHFHDLFNFLSAHVKEISSTA